MAALAVAPFLGTLSYDLVWDDNHLLQLIERIERAEGLRGIATTELLLGEMTPWRTGLYRPLVLLSLWADLHAGDGSPAGFHATNLALHALNTVLVFALLGLLVPATGAFWGAAIFAVHPVHAESVAFVSGRSDLLAATFVLAGAILWLRDREGLAKHQLISRVAGSLALLMAALAKESAAVLPAALLLWEFIAPHPPAAGMPARARRVTAWVLGWVAAIAALLVLRDHLGIGMTRALGERGAAGIAAAMANPPLFFSVWITYVRLLVLPFPPNPWYTATGVHVTATAVAAVAVFAGLCWVTGRRRGLRSGALAAVWFVVFLTPPATARLDVALAERYLYLPSVALALAVGGLGALAKHSGRRGILWAWGIWGAILLAGLGGTFSNSVIWRDELTLFSHMTTVSPDAAIGHKNLGVELSKAGRDREAVLSYQRALALTRSDAELFYNLGCSYENLGDSTGAAAAYREALRLKPGMVDATIRLWRIVNRP